MISEAMARASAKYKKAHIKRISLDVQKDFYEQELLPRVKASGETVNGYIKKAILERMERDNG